LPVSLPGLPARHVDYSRPEMSSAKARNIVTDIAQFARPMLRGIMSSLSPSIESSPYVEIGGAVQRPLTLDIAALREF
jgi:hypothetical protein